MARNADIHFEHAQFVAVFVMDEIERDVRDAHHFAALSVDNLLIQQIAHQPQNVFVGMVRGELLVLEKDSIERDGADLIVAHVEPSPSTANEVTVYAGCIYQRNKRGIFEGADFPALKVIDLEAEKFGEEKKIRHRE